MHEVWSSPLYNWLRCGAAFFLGYGAVMGVHGWTFNESWLWGGIGAFLAWHVWPRRNEWPLLQRPILLAGLRADGIQSEWPVSRLIPYDMVRGVSASGRQSFTHATITLDPEAPYGRRHRKIRLLWTSDAPAALFLVALERRTGVPTETLGFWFGREVEKEREKLAAWSRRRATR